MLSTFLSTFFCSLTNLNNFYIYIKMVITQLPLSVVHSAQSHGSFKPYND